MLKATSTSVCTIGFFSVPELPLSASLLILLIHSHSHFSRDGVPVKLSPA